MATMMTIAELLQLTAQDILHVVTDDDEENEVSSSSDEEETQPWGGSANGKAPSKERDFEGAYEILDETHTFLTFSTLHGTRPTLFYIKPLTTV
jgi:hypothetical protein